MDPPLREPWRPVDGPDGLSVTDIARSGDGRLWCVTAEARSGQDGRLMRVEGELARPVDLPRVRTLRTLVDGTIVAAGSGGVHAYIDERWVTQSGSDLDVTRVWGVSIDDLLACTRGSLLRLHRGRWTHLETPADLDHLTFNDIDGLPDGIAWAVGNDCTHSAVVRVEGGVVHWDEATPDFNVFLIRAFDPARVIASGEGGILRRAPAEQRDERGWLTWERLGTQIPYVGVPTIATDAAYWRGRLVMAGVTLAPRDQSPWLWVEGGLVDMRLGALGRASIVRLLPPSTVAVGLGGGLGLAELDALLPTRPLLRRG